MQLSGVRSGMAMVVVVLLIKSMSRGSLFRSPPGQLRHQAAGRGGNRTAVDRSS